MLPDPGDIADGHAYVTAAGTTTAIALPGQVRKSTRLGCDGRGARVLASSSRLAVLLMAPERDAPVRA